MAAKKKSQKKNKETVSTLTYPPLTSTGKALATNTHPNLATRNSNIAKDVTRMMLEGKPKHEIDNFIAGQYGLSVRTATNLRLKNKDIQQAVQGVVARYAEEIDDISDKFINLCKNAASEKVQLSAIQEFHSILNISPSKQPTTIMNNILNAEGANFQLDRGTLQAIAQFVTGGSGMADCEVGEIIDVNLEEDNSSEKEEDLWVLQ